MHQDEARVESTPIEAMQANLLNGSTDFNSCFARAG